MGNRKPRSVVDRLPTDYPNPRRPDRSMEERNDWGAMLALTPLTAEERAARIERARAVLRAYGAEDLAAALGLDDKPAPVPGGPLVKVRIVDAPCPKCNAQPGQLCGALKSGKRVSYHEERRRRAAEMQQEAA